MNFLLLINSEVAVTIAAPVAYGVAAVVNYILCVLFLFRHQAQWNSVKEIAVYISIVALLGWFDLLLTQGMLNIGLSIYLSKISATAIGLLLNFLSRRFFVFAERSSGPWQPMLKKQ